METRLRGGVQKGGGNSALNKREEDQHVERMDGLGVLIAKVFFF